MDKKNILLISYVFPPYPGIGGRRWAKFAKYLAKEGYIVYVISARSFYNETSNWNEDVNDKQIINKTISPKYSKYLFIGSSNIFQKVVTKLEFNK